VVFIWVAAIFAGNGLLSGLGGADTNADFSLPGKESTEGSDLLEDNFGGQGAGFGGQIVFESDKGVDDPAVKDKMEKLFAKVEKIDGIGEVGSPYSEQGDQQVATEGDLAGKVAYASVDFEPDLGEAEFSDAAKETRETVLDAEGNGVRVEMGGQAFAEQNQPTSEQVGVAFAIIILILAFGSVLAMGLPIGVAISGIALGTALAGFLSFIIHPPSFAAAFGLMIGLGVGIDYALFIVTRYRENLHAGHDNRSAVALAIDTAGRAVLFAGTTVVISTLGMFAMGLSFINGMAVAIATVVAATMAASLTLLPALLGFAGSNIDITRLRGVIAAAFLAVGLIGAGLEIQVLSLGFLVAFLLVLPGLLASIAHLAGRKFHAGEAIGNFFDKLTPKRLRRVVERSGRKPLRETAAYRWSRIIQHRPWPAAIGGAVILIILAIPLSSLRLAFTDEGNFPTDTTTRQAYDLIADGFGEGYNGQLMLVAEKPGDISDSSLEAVTAALRGTDGVAFASEPMVSDNGAAVAWRVVPTTAPQDQETSDLVQKLRDEVVPSAVDGTQLDVKVSGLVAVMNDFSDYLSSRTPVFFTAVLLLSFLLLMVVFRSLLVPLKAVIMNLLSIGAAYGVVVVGFQWGWLGGILGFDKGPIEPWLPMMMFAILFGLSMDYEVFLLSRVREQWLRTGNSRTSVADGLAATARVITAAALIMVFVFGAFLLEPDRVTKLMGIGLATAVFLDATIVRMLLVPATMELLGDKNWWIPKWLDRILPRLDVEGGGLEEAAEEGERQPQPAGV
jgi:RND superfamily putative drug exporter